MKIHEVPDDSLATIVAGLVKQGLQFEVWPERPGLWTITLTGGY